MSVIYRYFLILAACTSLLVGIQIPSFVDQYEKRLDAHFIEAQNNLRGYREIADKYHGGSIEALITKHEQSADPTFREEAKPIKNIYQRYLRFSDQKRSLESELVGKAAFIVMHGDEELINETYSNYSFTIPLTRLAVLSGFFTAALVVLVIELLRLLLSLFRFTGRSPRRAWNSL
ncbi:MAG: DUF2937 family protein [Burkholderiales bacterium]|nr:DUF2937 family protein [Burkholderiales bacterium]